MDVLTRKTRRRAGADSDEDSDDGPPPDPDEPAPAPAPKKEKKPTGEAKEVQVSVRKTVDDKSMQLGGGLTAMRREMLMQIRAEEDERWDDYEFCDGEVRWSVALSARVISLCPLSVQALASNEAFEAIFSQSDEQLLCNTDITSALAGIKGL